MRCPAIRSWEWRSWRGRPSRPPRGPLWRPWFPKEPSRQHRRTPQRDDQRANYQGRPLDFDKSEYRRRSIIEQCIGWLKECRRIGTRFEKLAINFLAMVKVAMIQRYLRFSFSDTA